METQSDVIGRIVDQEIYPGEKDHVIYVTSHVVDDGGPLYTLRVDVRHCDMLIFVALGNDAVEFLTALQYELELVNR
jgi:hypothetical protein